MISVGALRSKLVFIPEICAGDNLNCHEGYLPSDCIHERHFFVAHSRMQALTEQYQAGYSTISWLHQQNFVPDQTRRIDRT